MRHWLATNASTRARAAPASASSAGHRRKWRARCRPPDARIRLCTATESSSSSSVDPTCSSSGGSRERSAYTGDVSGSSSGWRPTAAAAKSRMLSGRNIAQRPSLPAHRGAASGQIGPWREGYERGGPLASTVADATCERQHEVSARRVTRQDNRPVRPRRQPIVGTNDILERRRQSMLRSKAVADAEDTPACQTRQCGGDRTMGCRRAGDEAAAMNVEDGAWSRRRRRQPFSADTVGGDRLALQASRCPRRIRRRRTEKPAGPSRQRPLVASPSAAAHGRPDQATEDTRLPARPTGKTPHPIAQFDARLVAAHMRSVEV